MASFFEMYEIGKDIWRATGNWFGYINSLDANMQNLKRKIEELSSHEDDIKTELSSAEHQPRKRRKKLVEDWFLAVQTIKGDVRTLQRQQQELVGCKYVFPRAQLGKLVAEKIQEVEKLREKGNFPNGLVIDDPTSGEFIPTTASFCETTCARNKEDVWNCLVDDEVRRIGVYGMGGVGKTTIMHHINNRLLNETCNFGDVIFVTVSKAFNVSNLQRVMANKLNLNISDFEDKTRTATELYAKLSQKDRYVLILDDLWEEFPLDKVGIPEPTKVNGCKLVLTTRSSEVCRKMGCKEIKVELLTEEEALNLFMRTVEEDQTKLARETKEIATKIAKECACLPLAIITVAGSMKGSRVDDIREWRNALNELISVTKQIGDIESDPVFGPLKFSYNRLKGEKLQHCFLYCALYPEDHKIPREELIDYWIAEGLITEMNSREAMFDKGHTILNKLIDTCLLESATDFGVECVRMHDLIRDMALKITSTSPRFMVRAGEGLERVPYEDWSKDLEKVSLMFSRINKLDFGPSIWPRLTTLLLRQPYASILSFSLLISDSFFSHMPRLKVLDLSYNRMESPPKSIFELENLQALLLEGMDLREVPSLEKLKALRELKLGNNMFSQVPQGIEELVNLRNLDLSWNILLNTFPWKSCKLAQLQRLRIDETSLTVSAGELLCLTKLEVVGARFHNVQELTSYVTSPQCQHLKNYRFILGRIKFSRKFSRYGFERYFDFMENDVFDFMENEVIVCGKEDGYGIGLSENEVDSLVLPNNIKGFVIRSCHGLTSLSDIPSLRDAKKLRKCQITGCNRIESIISSSSFSSEDYQIPLRTVEILRLDDLCRLRVLFDGIVPPHNISFKLKELFFNGCFCIESIFPVNLLQNFPNLVRLEVVGCKLVKDIIKDEEEMNDRGGHLLRNLKFLSLRCLPNLESICKSIMVCESIRYIEVHECPMLRRLPLSLHEDGEQSSAPPTLQWISGSDEWWDSLIWDDHHTKTTLEPFFVLPY